MYVHCRKQFCEVVGGGILKEGVEGNEGECARREESMLMYFPDFLA